MSDGDESGGKPVGKKTRTIRVDTLARVEGEGALRIELVGGRAERVELRLFEPPRFFEAFLRGRSRTEVPDITARICGICPVAYQMSSCHALEAAAGVVVDGPLRELRRLLGREALATRGTYILFAHLLCNFRYCQFDGQFIDWRCRPSTPPRCDADAGCGAPPPAPYSKIEPAATSSRQRAFSF